VLKIDGTQADDRSGRVEGQAMLRNLSVRTKLIVMVAVPMVVLGLVTVPAAESRTGTDRELFLLLSVSGIALTLLVVSLMARSVTAPLTRLTRSAEALSKDQLPGLVEALLSPSEDDHRYLAAVIQPIEVRSRDELGQLAVAFNALQTTAVDVAAQQAALLRKGIGDLFVNLARRNQSLIDRQIQLLDQLESDEEDPDVLAELFRLDHLATRMRRNAESLLVLAGVESTRRRSQPVPLLDTVRSAISEVEDYTRIEIVTLDDVVVVGGAVVDVAHLLAELMDNATQFAPPETAVSVSGRRRGTSYQLTVTDQGLGMTDEQLAAANELLARPPVVGLAMSRTLGFVVTARIASRHGISVRLDRSLDGGITASVMLPPSILTDAVLADDDRVLPPGVRPAPALVDEPVPAHAPRWVDESSWGDESLPATLAEAVPTGSAFDDGLQALLAAAPPAPRADDQEFDAGLAAVLDEEPAAFVEPAVELGPAAPPEVTAAGLVRRVPSAALASNPIDEAPACQPRRSPEEVRAMLSRYRSGLEAGRTAPFTEDEGWTSHDG
jgi:HAMP domain-containing protein